jgi:hypothetical protein
MLSDDKCIKTDLSSIAEVRLSTHEVEITLPTTESDPHGVFRAIFLTSAQIGTDETLNRLQRLCNTSGGRHVAVVLLLAQLEQGQGNGVTAMMRLQLE